MTNAERHLNRYIRRHEERINRKTNYNKQYDNIDNVIDPENLIIAFEKSKKGVSWKYSVQSYRFKLLSNTNEIIQSVKQDILPSKGFKFFQINERGKTRDIASPSFIERVFMKSLCDNVMLPIFSRLLIYDNGASLKGKGTSFARSRLRHHLDTYRKQNGQEGYCLSIDFTKYFGSIDHPVLKKLIANEIKDKQILSLCFQAIDEFGPVGLGLGSQSSQIWSIFYPNKLDHFIKDKTRNIYYGRYMDDIYIISNDKDHLISLLSDIKSVCDKLKIRLNEKKTHITKLSKGVSFLHCRYNYSKTGKIMKCGGKETCKRARHKLYYFKKCLDCGNMDIKSISEWYKSWRGYMLQFDTKTKLLNTDRIFRQLFGGTKCSYT